MPMCAWKPEFHIQKKKRKVWGQPPDISPRKFLKKGQLIKINLPPQRRNPTKDEMQILYEREIYRFCNLHASTQELQRQYDIVKHEKVYPGMVRAWLTNSYLGETDTNGMPDGQGSAYLGNGAFYVGTFKKGLLHEEGCLTWGKGSCYKGNFYYNCIFGNGIYNWYGGTNYNGQIYDGIPHGIGTMEGDNGFTYAGTWQHGRREGQVLRIAPGKGTMTSPHKSATYKGSWKDDKKSGEGQLIFTTGSFYQGAWLDGKRQGPHRTQVQCIIHSKQSSINEMKVGMHSHGLAMKGMSDSVYAHTYVGEWMGGLPHGSGKSEWLWNDECEDRSVLTNSYIGSYENGMRHGNGCFYYASGALFKGYWRNNVKVGLGVLVYESGKMHFGVFSHDRYDPITSPNFDLKEWNLFHRAEYPNTHKDKNDNLTKEKNWKNGKKNNKLATSITRFEIA